MMKKLPISIAIASLCNGVLLAPMAFADSEDQITVFKTVTVTAPRIEQTAQKASRSIDSVDRQQLDDTQPMSIAEALKHEPNITVAGGPVPGNQSVNIRGLEGNKVLQVIDGIRVNTNFTHRPSYFLDPALVSNIDVIKGPVGSLFGSGAVGGVVSQQTISADDLVAEGKEIGGLVKTGYSDNGNQTTATAAIAGKSDSVDWLIAGSFFDGGAMEQGNGDTLFGSETRNRTLLAKVNWALNDHHSIGLNYRGANTDGTPPIVGSANGQLNTANSLIDRDTTDEHISLNYKFNPASQLINVDSNLYQNSTSIEETNINNGEDVSDIDTIGFTLTNQSEFGKFNLLSGLDGHEDSLDTERPVNMGGRGDGRPNPPNDAQTTMFGAFIYGDYAITENVVIEGGLRYDQFSSEAEGFADSDESALSPSIGASWQAKEWALFSLRYDSAFRAPDVYELFMDGTHFAFFPGGPTNVFVPNPDLEAETSTNIELKGEFEFSNIFANDKLNVTASIFDNQIDDFIQLAVESPRQIPPMCFIPGMGAGCAGTSTSSNITNASIQGFEVAAVYQLDALTAAISYGQTRGENDDTGEHLTTIPADKWTLSIDYSLWSIDSKVGFKAIHASDQDNVPNNDTEGPYEQFTTVDFYASWEPSNESLEGLKVDVTVINAFDQNYRNAWTTVFEAGRAVRIAAQYNF
jgi:hemoglobin/transferrin/lactoferrin receptor protein